MIYQVIGLSLVACILVLVVKNQKPELAILVSIAAGCIILGFVFSKITPLIDQVREIVNYSGIDGKYIEIMLKALGICYLTQFATDTCNDFGQTALASKVELCGKLSIAAITLPLLIAYLDMIKNLIG